MVTKSGQNLNLMTFSDARPENFTDESKILRSKKIKVVTPHENCRFWFNDDNTKLLPSQFGYVLYKKNVFKAI